MLISEIFSSCEGEGLRTGYLATFIRTYGCNLRCTYCDSMYAVDEKRDLFGKNTYKNMELDEIVKECKKLNNKRITLTGGEPLIQKNIASLLGTLKGYGFEINIETNGAVPLDAFVEIPVMLTMDWKSPYSGMRDKMIEKNLDLLREWDVLKFVVASKEDLDDMKEIILNHKLNCHIFVSPVFGKIEPVDIVEYMKENNLQQARLQLQIHKLIWDKDKRGV